ncbi:lipopolysaccharide biosynthesis protein [Balneolales bacterium ANBcel1]|nr:lipopolysaccharide biosynthesis protein [Balneolales bacterium ANBcel1]
MKHFDSINAKIKYYLQKLAGSGSSGSVLKNMSILASGSGAAKVIGLATYPVITRIYSPADFGVMAVFTSAITILVPFATMRYSITLPLPKTDVMAMNIFVLGSLLIIALSLILSGMFVVAGEAVFGFFNMNEIASYWWLLIIGILGASFYELLSNWATRKKSFTPIAKTNIWQSSISAITKIGLGYAGLKPMGLLIGVVAQRGSGVFSLMRYFLNDFKENIDKVTPKRIIFIFKYYRDLPLYRLPSQFLLVFATKMPVLFFAFQYGAETTGQLGLSILFVGIPMGLIGTTTAKAYYAEIAMIGAKQREKILSVTKSITKRLFLLSLIPTLILLLFSPFLFQFIFGAEWIQAGEFTSILAFYLFIQFITTPLVNIFTVYNMQRKFLEINIVRIIIVGVVFGMAYNWNMDVYQTLLMYTISISGHYIFTGYQVYKIIK